MWPHSRGPPSLPWLSSLRYVPCLALWAFEFATTALVNAVRLEIENKGMHYKEEEIKVYHYF